MGRRHKKGTDHYVEIEKTATQIAKDQAKEKAKAAKKVHKGSHDVGTIRTNVQSHK